MIKARKLPVEKLRWTCDPAQFHFETTTELPELEGTLGQDRALRSIEFGLDMSQDGFNLYLIGDPGTGRTSTIKNILKKRAKSEPPPCDWCYVNNFRVADVPISLMLPAGMGTELEKEMKDFIEGVRHDIPKALDSKDYESHRAEIMEQYQEKNGELFGELEAEANAEGFSLQRTVSGLVMVPQKDDRNYTQEEYEALAQPDKDELDAKGKGLTDKLNDVLRQVRDNEKNAKDAMANVDRELCLSAVGHHLEPMREKYAKYEKVLMWLEEVQEDIVNNMEDFKPQGPPPQSPIPGLKIPRQEPDFERYKVNVFVDNKETVGAPVIFEANPTYNNLFGRTEHVMQMGGVATTNFTLIKPGALHKANGGYLIVDAREVLINPFAWDALKRCIRSGEIRIEDILEQYRFMTTVSLKPEPVPLQAKIIMIGTAWIYYLLYYMEPDYRRFFKVKAEFDSIIKRSPEVLEDYALFVATHCKNENLLPFDRTAVARLMEHSARLVEDQEKLSAQFMEIADTIREASYWAKRAGKEIVTAEFVKQAVEEKVYRSNRVEERMQQLFEEGTILVDTEGAVPGQINGLAVMTIGDYAFGRPSRVTTRVYLGRAGMVNIEREAKLSGPIHDKGVMILQGYLGDKFAQDKPLSFSATICFEQSYNGIEGDSASSTELYSLLSAFSGVPIKQNIAVTGSVNQRGQVQPIGGVNFKIEGFFAVCKAKGLTGDQGVMIPVQNERHLMLSDEVMEAVKDGKFHIWSVETIDQGIEILTGIPAGERQEDGTYPEGTINYMVDKRLRDMLEQMKKVAGPGEKEKGENGAAEPAKIEEGCGK